METLTAHLLIHIESFIIQQFVNNKKRAHITFYTSSMAFIVMHLHKTFLFRTRSLQTPNLLMNIFRYNGYGTFVLVSKMTSYCSQCYNIGFCYFTLHRHIHLTSSYIAVRLQRLLLLELPLTNYMPELCLPKNTSKYNLFCLRFSFKPNDV